MQDKIKVNQQGDFVLLQLLVNKHRVFKFNRCQYENQIHVEIYNLSKYFSIICFHHCDVFILNWLDKLRYSIQNL